jgi:hypothetical protein
MCYFHRGRQKKRSSGRPPPILCRLVDRLCTSQPEEFNRRRWRLAPDEQLAFDVMHGARATRIKRASSWATKLLGGGNKVERCRAISVSPASTA